MRTDTQVGLEFQGLTGIAAVALRGGSQAAPAPVSAEVSRRCCRPKWVRRRI